METSASLAARDLVPARSSLSDRYGALLLVALACYALLGKGFAYAGIPPIFVTEGILALGLVVLLRVGGLLAAISTLPMILVVTLIVWAVVRMAPDLSRYGVDTLRDSVIVLYAIFAVVVVALLLQRPERLASTLKCLQWLTGLYVFVAPVMYLTNRVGFLPSVSGWSAAGGGPFSFVRPGEVAVHLSACAVMALLGLRSARPIWCCALIVAVCMIAAQSRGAMLSIVGSVGFALVVAQKWRSVGAIAVGGILLVGLIYVADFSIPVKDEEARSLSGRQIIENMASIVTSSDVGNLDGTKLWRLMWWRKIENYTLHGSYFWSGKGFGLNLAEDDGFLVGDSNAPALRSPHNSHLNILARLGVPGFTLWFLAGVSWLTLMLRHVFLAWRIGCKSWGDVMLLIVCYWLAIVIDASFDVAIEGPMIGVWFWCLFGFGVGVVMVYQAGKERIADIPRLSLPNARRHSPG